MIKICWLIFYNFIQIAMSTALQDIKLETIDFQWIKETTKLSHLKKAIALIDQDGNYYSQLKDACYARMEEIDPSCKRLKFDNHLTPQVKATLDLQLNQWEANLSKNQKNKAKSATNLEDFQSYFDNQLTLTDEKKKLDMAERERLKGNEALKSKDFDQAITYYSKSIELDPNSYQSFGNRALVYLKKKNYHLCQADCDKALSISPTYTKAMHRKAKALVGLKKRVEGYQLYKEIMKLEPDNNEVNKEMKELRQEMNPNEISQTDKAEFRKIVIQQDSDEEIQDN